MDTVSPQRASELIGLIYDCAADPGRWHSVMQTIGEELHCMQAMIAVLDLRHSKHKYFAGWNIETFYRDCMEKYATQITMMVKFSSNPATVKLDDPRSMLRILPRFIYDRLPIYRKLLKPMGMCDAIQSVVLRDAANKRLGAFFAVRHADVGELTDREFAVMRLIAPHLRRAVTIGDLLNLDAQANETLAACLNTLDTGVVIVDGGARVLDANLAAEQMFVAGAPVRSVDGRLAATSSQATDELRSVVAAAHVDEAAIGGRGIGIPLRRRDDALAIAHVLPLATGETRPHLASQAAAAVFVADGSIRKRADLNAVARQFGLTAGETRVVEFLLDGVAVSVIALRLRVSEAAVRKHIQSIFRKTGVSRMPELAVLLNSLGCPARGKNVR